MNNKKSKIVSILSIFILAISLSGLCLAKTAQTNKAFTYKALGICFVSPIPLPSKDDIGASKGETIEFGIPGALEGHSKFKIIISKYSQVLLDGIGDKPDQLRDYGRTVYLASSKPAKENVSRTFQNKTLIGIKEESKIPSPAIQESYLVTFGKTMYFIGIKYDKDFSSTEAEKIITSLFGSLKAVKVK